MVVFEELKTVLPRAMSGIIEPDETYQRESQKGSREWVCYERDTFQPKTTPKPPRKRWYEYPKRRPPHAIALEWSEPILGVVDRTGRTTFQHMADTLQPTIVPQVAFDAMVLLNGAPQYEAIARARGTSYNVLVAGRRTKRMPKTYHLNSVSSLHPEWKRDFRGRWRGPAAKYLDGYTRWMLARRDSDPLAILQSIIALAKPTLSIALPFEAAASPGSAGILQNIVS